MNRQKLIKSVKERSRYLMTASVVVETDRREYFLYREGRLEVYDQVGRGKGQVSLLGIELEAIKEWTSVNL